MNTYLINYVKNLVKQACYQETNIFGENIWGYHIIPVVSHTIVLSKKFNTDLECAILSAYFHDYASVLDKNYYEEHQIYGAQLAGEILEKKRYPDEKIEIIKNCILNHRGSIDNKESTLESICLSSADAMAHITEVPSLLFLAYNQKKMSIAEGNAWVLKKVQQSWEKMCEDARDIVRDKYYASISMLAKSQYITM